jgi:hypothetical protein
MANAKQRIVHRLNIAVADERNGMQLRFHPGNFFPVCFPAIHVRRRSTVYRDPRTTR